MSAKTMSAPGSAPLSGNRAGQTIRHGASTTIREVRTRRARGAGRATSPAARPRYSVAAPQLRPSARVDAGARVATASQWRLTERGLAVIMVAGLMVVMAALVVVGATALRVTGESYRPTISSANTQTVADTSSMG